jgi:hypothetical protein
VPRREAEADARLAFSIATASALAMGVFVVVPSVVTDLRLPAGIDALWALAGLLTMVLGPVAAGLSGYASLVALWTRGDVLPASARHLHLLTLVVAAALFCGLVSVWGSGVVSWWLD